MENNPISGYLESMKALVAPNALKGSLTSREAASIMGGALPESWQSVLCPIADGGDGTLDCLIEATRGKFFESIVPGPLPSRKVKARWGVLGDGKTAVIEMAEASGLRLLSPSEHAATETTTAGVGELIRIALDDGYQKFLVGLGGSATNDGGAGCMKTLGARFFDSVGNELDCSGKSLVHLKSIDLTEFDKRLSVCEFIGLADVNNVLHGPAGAAHTFAGQKGASVDEIELLDKGLRTYSEILHQQLKVDVARISGSGAAGGLGGGLIAFCNARIVSGIDFILDLIKFDYSLRDCDLVLTAEGSLDAQTVRGKGIAG